jgi:hypothetical protein
MKNTPQLLKVLTPMTTSREQTARSQEQVFREQALALGGKASANQLRFFKVAFEADQQLPPSTALPGAR